MISRVGERGQITIPKSLRQQLGIRPGDEVEFELDDTRLVLRRLIPQDPIHRIVGILKGPVDVKAYLEEARGPDYDPRLDPPGPLDLDEDSPKDRGED
jgi:AbrB family looped-hinge helix DNA binding protein